VTYSAGGELAWLSLTAVTCVGLITQGVSFSVTLITLPLTFSTSPWRWIAFLFGYPDPFSRGWPQASRAVCVTKNETLKFVNIARSDGMPGSSFTITISMLHGDYDDMRWVTDTTIQAANLWDMEGYDDQLPRVVPQFRLVSMDDPNIIYFVLKERRTVSSAKAWVVALNIDSSMVLWYKDIKAIPSDEDTEMAFFPTEFTKHLQKAAVR